MIQIKFYESSAFWLGGFWLIFSLCQVRGYQIVCLRILKFDELKKFKLFKKYLGERWGFLFGFVQQKSCLLLLFVSKGKHLVEAVAAAWWPQSEHNKSCLSPLTRLRALSSLAGNRVLPENKNEFTKKSRFAPSFYQPNWISEFSLINVFTNTILIQPKSLFKREKKNLKSKQFLLTIVFRTFCTRLTIQRQLKSF